MGEFKKWYFCKYNSDPFCEHHKHEYCEYKECEDYCSPEWRSSQND